MSVLTLLLVLNVAAFGLFGWDKACARKGWRRIPEQSFLSLALLGGWPALKAGQRLFRHKTQKQPFGLRLNIAAGLNIAALALWAYSMSMAP